MSTPRPPSPPEEPPAPVTKWNKAASLAIVLALTLLGLCTFAGPSLMRHLEPRLVPLVRQIPEVVTLALFWGWWLYNLANDPAERGRWATWVVVGGQGCALLYELVFDKIAFKQPLTFPPGAAVLTTGMVLGSMIHGWRCWRDAHVWPRPARRWLLLLQAGVGLGGSLALILLLLIGELLGWSSSIKAPWLVFGADMLSLYLVLVLFSQLASHLEAQRSSATPTPSQEPEP